MKTSFFLPLLLWLLPWSMRASDDSISRNISLEGVSISATRAGANTPMTYNTIQKDALQRMGPANNIPYLLQLTPSLVMTTENGTGAGNTSFRIRGSDASRINVTLNGLPLNNPESQEVFWVNLPDLSSSLQSLQIQRGVGASSSGSGAFGGSINLETQKIRSAPSAEASVSLGSYGTFLSTIAAGTGLTKTGLWADLRYSKLLTDGYVRNGKADHQNVFATVGYANSKHLVKVNWLYGEQHTGITWEGSSREQLDEDRRYNPSGIYYDEAGNIQYYDNETDNYYSHILQAFYVYSINKHWEMQTAFNYTNGFGYYENYKEDQKFSKFGLPSVVIDGTTYNKSDVIRQKMMRNDFYAGNVIFKYQHADMKMHFGGMYSHYVGDHFGRLPWIKYAGNIAPNYEWYRNQGRKTDADIFVKGEYLLTSKWSLFADLQMRYVRYRLEGSDDSPNDANNALQFDEDYPFFNPKVGVNYHLNDYNSFYASVSTGHREPGRSIIKESVKSSEIRAPRAERMIDYELGYKHQKERWAVSGNLYYMSYKDQLVPNGALNDNGYKLMDNVDKSYRMGVELQGEVRLGRMWSLMGNVTLSQNRILDYIDQRPLLDPDSWEVSRIEEIRTQSTDLAFSPAAVAAAEVAFRPWPQMVIALNGKYVSSQYMDNSSEKLARLDPYGLCNLRLGYDFTLPGNSRLSLELFVHNLLNAKYVSNGWISHSYFTDGSRETYSGYFAQAPTHFNFKISYSFR